MKKIRVGILFGGKSAEHEVSLQSAKNIIEALDRDKYEIVLLGIDKKGQWYLNNTSTFILNSGNPEPIKLNRADNTVTLVPGRKNNQLINLSNQSDIGSVDVVFPVLHGPFGEDVCIQNYGKQVG